MKPKYEPIPTPADVTGILMPNRWDENGKVIEIALYTNKEEVYVVEDNSLTKRLLNLMQKKIKVKGNIRTRTDGNKSIGVKNYSILE